MPFKEFAPVKIGDLKVNQRVLPGNKNTSLPSLAIYLDTETKQRRSANETHHRMRLGWTCAVRYDKQGRPKRETWRYHESSLELCRYIESLTRLKTTTYLFAHNVFFDSQVADFYYYFSKWGWTLDFWYDKGLSYILAIRKDKRLLKLCSTTNYFDTSVKELGKLLDLPKQEVDFKKVSKEALRNYCHRDVEIIKSAMEFYFRFIIDHDLGTFAYTRASQAFHAYRHRFMKVRIKPYDNEEIKALERSAYFGGRTECFEIGKIKGGPFMTLDINSMYPYLMKTLPVPVKLVDFNQDVPVDYIKDRVDNWLMVADVIIETNVPIYPIKKNNKLVFPVGRFRTSLCSPSLNEAIKRGHLKEVKKVAIYTGSIIFDKYVDYFYFLRSEYKKEGKPILDRLCKIMLNSLYGKFGQKKTLIDWEENFEPPDTWREETIDLVTGEKEIAYKMFNKIIREVGETDAKNSFCAISAHITDAARVLLWKIIEEIGHGHVLYCDTDSIKIRSSDFDRVKYPINNQALGALKVEDTFNEFEILGPKTYITENKRVMKGIPVSAKMLDHYRYQYDTWLRQATHLKKGIDRYFIVRDTIKEISPEYDKGIVTETGKVIPFQL
jgi:YD repeat-containing protein